MGLVVDAHFENWGVVEVFFGLSQEGKHVGRVVMYAKAKGGADVDIGDFELGGIDGLEAKTEVFGGCGGDADAESHAVFGAIFGGICREVVSGDAKCKIFEELATVSDADGLLAIRFYAGGVEL